MNGVCGMHEKRGLSGAIEGSHDFLGDDGTLAYAGKNGPARLCEQNGNYRNEIVIDVVF